ncbi:DUF6313 family protein [Streptomyces sp. NPDC016845]|uniref:DUF6313 family protein n=1 Tax=Streptomyces sp. NPDC016845 TaxID=3364972 RepID=UPI0037B327ED
MRDEYRGLSRFNRPVYWLLTRGLWWLLGFGSLYVLCGFLIGWTTSYEVMVGITSPAQTRLRALSWMLSLTGWLATPAAVGGIVGYLVNRQVDRRRRESESAVLARMLREAGFEAPPTGGGSS